MEYDKRIDNLLSDMEQTVASIKAEREQHELKSQRATLLKPGGYQTKMENRSLELGDLDHKFLSYVRGQAGPSEIKALVEDGTGQLLISPAIEAELQRALASLVTIRPLASKRTTDKDRILVRTINEVTVGYGKLEIGGDVPESDPTPDSVTKYVEDLNGLAKIGVDELEDSDYDLAQYLAESFARAIAETENLKFLRGAGHSEQEPEGIVTDATLLANALTTTAAGAATIDDLMACIYGVPAQYRKGSCWIMNSTLALSLRKLRAGGSTTTDGPYLWQPSVIAGTPPQLLGYDAFTDDNMDDLSDTEGVLAIFGNLNLGYRIVDRKGISIQRLSELYAEAGLVGFLLRARNTGYCIRPGDKRIVLLKEHSA